MPALHDELTNIANTIVSGIDLPPGTQVFCPKYSVATALAVYRNNYSGNLRDTLAYAYPVIEQLVGKEFFQLLARQFVQLHRSASGNLHRYGAEMAGFIAEFEPARGLAYLPDVAALEWACHRAYFAEDDATLDVNQLSTVPQESHEDLVLHTHPACHLVRSRFPIAAIWNAHQPGANCDFRIHLDSGPSNALVSRPRNTVMVSELTDGEAVFLQNIRAEASLETATAAAFERNPDFDLSAALKNLIDHGIITNFALNVTP